MQHITANGRENEGDQHMPRGQRKKARRGKRSRQRAYERWILHRNKAAKRRQERGRAGNNPQPEQPEQTAGPAMYAQCVHEALQSRPIAIIHPQNNQGERRVQNENDTQPALQTTENIGIREDEQRDQTGGTRVTNQMTT
jgi:hypothetical protein